MRRSAGKATCDGTFSGEGAVRLGSKHDPAPQYPGALTLKLALLPIAVETPVT